MLKQYCDLAAFISPSNSAFYCLNGKLSKLSGSIPAKSPEFEKQNFILEPGSPSTSEIRFYRLERPNTTGGSSAGESQPDGAKSDANKSTDGEFLWNFGPVDTPTVSICSKFPTVPDETEHSESEGPGEDVGGFPSSKGLAEKILQVYYKRCKY